MRQTRPISILVAVATLTTAAHGQFDFGGGGGGGASSTETPWQSFKLNPAARVTLDFRNANVDAVIHMLSTASGVAIIKDPALVGGLTLQSPKPQSLSDAFAMLNAALGLRNYELVHQGNFLLIQAKPQGGRGFRGGGAGGGTGGFPFGGAAGMGSRETTVLRVYKITNASATQVAKVVNDVFGNTTPTNNQPQNPGFPGGFGNRGGNNNAARAAASTSLVKASSEDYSNSVIVNAPERMQQQIADIITQIDQPTQSAQQARVFKLQYAVASDLQTVIQNVLTNSSTGGRGTTTTPNQPTGGFGGFGGRFGGFGRFGGNNSGSTANGVVVADSRSNSLIVTTTSAALATVAQVIQQLDRPVYYHSTTFIYALKNARADVVTTLINNAFGNKLGGSTTNPGGSVTGTSISQGLSASSGTGALSLTTNNNNNRNNQQNTGTARTASTDTQITTGKDSYGHVVNVRDLTGQVTTIADIDRNSVIVVSPPEYWPLVKNILDQLDRVPKQVMIETLVVEATLDDTDKLGVEWTFAQGKPFGIKNGTATGTQNYGLETDPTQPQGFRYKLNAGQYTAFLQAVSSNNKFNVLSTPRIFTTNNASAQINISESIPYITSTITDTNGGVTNSYSFLDVGIVLTVTPRITSNGYVTMDVTQTANDLVGYTSFNAPQVNQREAQTTVSVKDGETAVLGGIMNTTLTKNSSKVPLLGDIPLIGNLFKSNSKERKKTELLVFMTPRVVSDPEDLRQLRQDTQKSIKLDPSVEKDFPENFKVKVTQPGQDNADAAAPLINGEIPTTFLNADGTASNPELMDTTPPNGQPLNTNGGNGAIPNGAGNGNAGGDAGGPAGPAGPGEGGPAGPGPGGDFGGPGPGGPAPAGPAPGGDGGAPGGP